MYILKIFRELTVKRPVVIISLGNRLTDSLVYDRITFVNMNMPEWRNGRRIRLKI